jgi:hypothetical protein
MKILLALGLVGLIAPAFSQQPGANPALQQKVAALKQSIAMNQQALHQYTWTEMQQMILKGDVKSTKMFQCQYGPDGKVQKSPIGPPQPPPSTQRGLKGRVVEKKKGEMQDYMQQVGALIKNYVPPSGPQIQQSFQSGKASIQPSGTGIVTLAFKDYALPGDLVTLTFDSATKKILGYDVNTYLNSPDQVVILKVAFDSLPDGTNYVSQSVLDATAKQIQIRTTSSGYSKL